MSDKPAPSSITVNDMIAGGQELAERIGISMKVFERLAIEGVMVRVSRGRYMVFASVQAYIRKLTNAASGRDGGVTGAARARLLNAQAEVAEIKQAALRGEFLPAKEVEEAWTAEVRQVRSRLLALPARLGAKLPQLTHADVAMIDDEIRAFLTELADSSTYEA